MNEKLDRAIRATSLFANQPIDKIKSQITAYLCMVTDSSIAFFGTMNPQQTEMTIIGFSAGAMVSCRMVDKPIVYNLVDTGLWGDSVRENKPVIVNDYEHSSRPSKKGHPEGHLKVKRYLGVPIREGNKVVMLVGLGNKTAEYTPEDAELIEQYMAEVWKMIKSKI